MQERETDAYGNVYKTAVELRAEELARRGSLAASPNVARPPPGAAGGAAAASKGEEEEEEEEEHEDWAPERQSAEAMVAALVQQWQRPINTLSKAGKAFEVGHGASPPMLL